MDIKSFTSGMQNPVDDVRKQALELITKMRNLNAEALPSGGIESTNSAQNFSKLFSDAVSNVNGMQTQAETLQKSYELGDPAVSLTQVVTATQSADVSFRLLMGLRNRAISAYREVMAMPV